MACTRVEQGNNVTITWTFIATKQIGKKKFEQAAEYFFDLGDGDHGTPEAPRIFTDLSEAEVNAIMNHRGWEWWVKASKTKKVTKDKKSAGDAAEAQEDSEVIPE